MRDAQGRQLTLSYNGSGQRTQIADAANPSRKLMLTYDGAGHIQSVSDGVRSVSYGYANGDLIDVTDVMGHHTNYSYRTSPSPTHQLTAISNAEGQTVEQIGYDGTSASARVITQTLQDGSARVCLPERCDGYHDHWP